MLLVLARQKNLLASDTNRMNLLWDRFSLSMYGADCTGLHRLVNCGRRPGALWIVDVNDQICFILTTTKTSPEPPLHLPVIRIMSPSPLNSSPYI